MDDKNLFLTVQPSISLDIIQSPDKIVSEMVDASLSTAKQRQPIAEIGEEWLQKGESYYYGISTPQNYTEAAECYRIAAELGSLCGSCNYGFMLARGIGVDKDEAQAIKFFMAAGISGHPVGLLNLSCLYGKESKESKSDLKSHIFELLARANNEPGYKVHPLRYLHAKEIGIIMSDYLLGGGRLFNFPPERIKKSITFYEVSEPPSGFDFKSDSEVYHSILRKVRLEKHPCTLSDEYSVIIYPGDSPLTCGDLLPTTVCEAFMNWVQEEGGLHAEAVVHDINGRLGDVEAFYSAAIVGQIVNNQVYLNSGPAHSNSGVILNSLFHRGLGVYHDESEAQL